MSKLRSRPDQVTRALTRGLYREAEEIMAESKRDFVPVDTGALRSTGHVEKPVVEFGKISVTLGYGGVASRGKEVGYAVYVHENLEAHHTVGEAKYLEKPLNAKKVGMARRLTEFVRSDLLKRG